MSALRVVTTGDGRTLTRALTVVHTALWEANVVLTPQQRATFNRELVRQLRSEGYVLTNQARA